MLVLLININIFFSIMKRFENSFFVVLWVLERFGKMEKWDKLWDLK
jgi:hypothetical protein